MPDEMEEMSEHLAARTISALLDEPGSDPGAASHLEACDRCAAEYEHMSRMRMALSGLGELDPPAGEWERIEARLDALDPAAPVAGRVRRGVDRFLSSWPLQAAAAVLLFGGGVLAGLQLTGGVGAGPAPLQQAAGGAAEEAGSLSDAGSLSETGDGVRPVALEEWAELAGFRSLIGPGEADAPLEPGAAAERLARLDALILASREAVERSPADPVANGLLFELVERRNELASDLGESLHLATVEYR